MKTTLELPDDLFRGAKIAAARQGRTLKELFTEALREKLMGNPQADQGRSGSRKLGTGKDALFRRFWRVSRES
ncbi:MAG: hypothetical protein ACI957_004866 [Verrucomicrobiales bacterium]|jgi:hypothetical protein